MTQIVTFVNTGRILTCYAPVDLYGGRDADGNIRLVWDRRTRINGAWVGGTDVPLGETTEQYQVIVYEDDTYAVAKITKNPTVPTVVITADEQTDAFGGLVNPCYFGVAQLGVRGYGYEGRGIA